MSLENLLKLSNNYPRAGEVIDAVERGVGLVQIEGLAEAAKALMVADAFVRTGRTLFVITYTHEQAERIAEDLPHYGVGKEQVMFYPASDSLIYEEGPPDFSIIGERLAALRALVEGKNVVVVAPINAALRRTMSPEMPAALLRLRATR